MKSTTKITKLRSGMKITTLIAFIGTGMMKVLVMDTLKVAKMDTTKVMRMLLTDIGTPISTV